MKIKFLFISLFFISIFQTNAQSVEVIKIEALENLLNHTPKDKIRVFNFWATWCKPCVQELPEFEALLSDKNAQKLEIYLISLDFASDLPKTQAFAQKRKLKSTVKILDEIDYNAWINKVEPSWSGAIPATLFVEGSSGRRVFYEKEFAHGELAKAVENFLSK